MSLRTIWLPQSISAITRASETADRRDCNTELYANPKKGSAADARSQQTDRLTSFCSVLFTTTAAAVIQTPVASPVPLSQECTNHYHCCSQFQNLPFRLHRKTLYCFRSQQSHAHLSNIDIPFPVITDIPSPACPLNIHIRPLPGNRKQASLAR